MIVDFAGADLRARTVGLCYLVRSLAIAPEAAIGSGLGRFAPQTPFATACIIEIIGAISFAATAEERHAS